MAQQTAAEVRFLTDNYLNHVLHTGIQVGLLPTSFKQLIGNTNKAHIWQKAISEGQENGFVFPSHKDQQAITFLRTFTVQKLNNIPVKQRSEAIENFLYFFMFGVKFQIRQMGVTALYAIVKTVDYMIKKGVGFTDSELTIIGNAVGVRLTKNPATEDFLGICLGGKKCKARKKSRQENRKARREIRTEKLRAKKDALVLENEATKSTNALLNQISEPSQSLPQPQQQQVFAKNQIADQQNAMPPIPPKNQPKEENNTLLWVGGGIGTLIVIGLILFLVLKK